MNFKCALLGFAGMVALLLGPAEAAVTDALSGYKTDVVKSVFVEIGATEMKEEVLNGEPRLIFKINGTTYVVDLLLCEDKVRGCQLMNYAIAFEPDDSDTVESVNRYNSEYVFGKAVLNKAEGLLSLRGVLWHPGATKAQIVSEFAAFTGATTALLEHMAKTKVASGQSGLPRFQNTAATRVQMPAAVLAKLRGIPRNRRR
jgi:hypothetical protein